VDDPSKPSWESFRSLQFRQIKISGNECFLGDIFSKMKIAQERIGIGHGHVLKTTDNLIVGTQIVSLRLTNKMCQFFHIDSLKKIFYL